MDLIYNHVRAGTTHAKLGGTGTTWMIMANTRCHMFRCHMFQFLKRPFFQDVRNKSCVSHSWNLENDMYNSLITSYEDDACVRCVHEDATRKMLPWNLAYNQLNTNFMRNLTVYTQADTVSHRAKFVYGSCQQYIFWLSHKIAATVNLVSHQKNYSDALCKRDISTEHDKDCYCSSNLYCR